ncbi:MAG TPA: DUF4214 domain-containing protein, partial [Gemmataceae bacterium]|nr:DUF4214 domain-containing protein [Gemmataceae bacterium]
NGTINGWTITANGQTITATRSDVLAAGGSYPALTITIGVALDAPASLTNTATVAGGGEVNTTNDSASDPTTISQVADLIIAISHGGDFTAGGTGTYTITVSNVGLAASNGPVMISDVLPTGLTYTGEATGDGWSVSATGQTITATRSDVLVSRASFPGLTLTVGVANDAPTTVTNTVTVSGGGELNTSNDSASDVAAGLGRRRRGSDSPTAYTGGVMATVLDGVANTFAHSQEYFTNLVMQDYQQLLHRTPATAEVSIWVNILQNGVSDEQVLAGFTSSPEYFQQSGSTDQAWIDALYHDLLNRSPDAAGDAAWLHALAVGNSRSSIALGFADSVEHESDVVSAAYQRYLGRTPGAAEVAGWISNLQHGMADEQVVAAFVASAEFYAGHGSSLQNWITGMYQLVFQRAPDPNGLNYWNQLLQSELGTG